MGNPSSLYTLHYVMIAILCCTFGQNYHRNVITIVERNSSNHYAFSHSLSFQGSGCQRSSVKYETSKFDDNYIVQELTIILPSCNYLKKTRGTMTWFLYSSTSNLSSALPDTINSFNSKHLIQIKRLSSVPWTLTPLFVDLFDPCSSLSIIYVSDLVSIFTVYRLAESNAAINKA